MNDAIQTIYDDVMRFIGNASQLLVDEPIRSMAEMKTLVERLTVAINRLPLEKRLEYRSQLDEIFKALQVLEGQLQKKRDEIRTELTASQQHRAANKAYIKAEHSDKASNDN